MQAITHYGQKIVSVAQVQRCRMRNARDRKWRPKEAVEEEEVASGTLQLTLRRHESRASSGDASSPRRIGRYVEGEAMDPRHHAASMLAKFIMMARETLEGRSSYSDIAYEKVCAKPSRIAFKNRAHVRREATHTSFRGGGSSSGGSGLGFRNWIFRTRYIARTGTSPAEQSVEYRTAACTASEARETCHDIG